MKKSGFKKITLKAHFLQISKQIYIPHKNLLLGLLSISHCANTTMGQIRASGRSNCIHNANGHVTLAFCLLYIFSMRVTCIHLDAHSFLTLKRNANYAEVILADQFSTPLTSVSLFSIYEIKQQSRIIKHYFFTFSFMMHIKSSCDGEPKTPKMWFS